VIPNAKCQCQNLKTLKPRFLWKYSIDPNPRGKKNSIKLCCANGEPKPKETTQILKKERAGVTING